MKTCLLLLAFVLSVPAFADHVLPVGDFNVPVRFESESIPENIAFLVTNDIARYYSSVSGFSSPSTNQSGRAWIWPRHSPPLVDKTRLFENGIRFTIENGTTNCIVSQAFTAAAALRFPQDEFVFRTNLVQEASSFLDTVLNGIIQTNETTTLRRLFRTVVEDELVCVSPAEASATDLEQALASYRTQFAFKPICFLDLEPPPPEMENVFSLSVRAVPLFDEASRRFITQVHLVHADGYWSFLY